MNKRVHHLSKLPRLLDHRQVSSLVDNLQLCIALEILCHLLHRLRQDPVTATCDEQSWDRRVGHAVPHIIRTQRLRCATESLETVVHDDVLDVPCDLGLCGVRLVNEPAAECALRHCCYRFEGAKGVPGAA